MLNRPLQNSGRDSRMRFKTDKTKTVLNELRCDVAFHAPIDFDGGVHVDHCPRIDLTLQPKD